MGTLADDINTSLNNIRLFKRPSCKEMRLIMAKHLMRGDLIRVAGYDFIVRGKQDGRILYTAFYLHEKLFGGGGRMTFSFGANSHQIVEYIGYYEYKTLFKSRSKAA